MAPSCLIPLRNVFLALLLLWWTVGRGAMAVDIAYEDCVALTKHVGRILGLKQCTQPSAACDECGLWMGVNELNRITSMNIVYDIALSSTVPMEWSALTGLTSLYVTGSNLSGTLPPQWSLLKNLADMGIEGNNLSGTLPPEWSALKLLSQLKLGNNSFSGTLPAEWSRLKKLSVLEVYSSSLSGTLPPEWSALKSLYSLYMYDNRLSGTLPPEWSGLSSLFYAGLNGGNLSGTLPAEWSGLKNLQSLEVQHNSLSGTLPAEWSVLAKLYYLDVSHNERLSAAVPRGWSRMPDLGRLSLSCPTLDDALVKSWEPVYKQIVGLSAGLVDGTLPSRLSKLSSLQYLNVSNSMMTGTLPTWVTALDKLTSLDMSHNQLTSTLPIAWNELSDLQALALSNNSLNGSLPTAFSRLNSLNSLDLSNNHLSGTLPPPWSDIFQPYPLGLPVGSLAILKLAGNNLHGPIPSEWMKNSTWWNIFVYIDISSNRLTGPLPHLPSSIQLFNASYNTFSGPLPAIPPALVYLHVASNNLSGPLPDVENNKKLVFVDISNNKFSALPSAFQAHAAIFFNASHNALQGPLPSSNYSHPLVYCDMSGNQLSGTVPYSWHQHNWSYLALDHNKLSGSLPEWAGHVEVLLLQHNQLSGCVLPNVSQTNGIKVLSLASNGIKCLPPDWSSRLTSLSLLDVNGTLADSVPLEWMKKGAFSKGNESTVLRLGSLWVSSAKHDSQWRRNVCIQKDLNDKLSQSLTSTTLPARIQGDIQGQINQGLAKLTATLRSLNVTGVTFNIGQLQLRQDKAARNVTRQDVCGNSLAEPIVIIQYTFLGLALFVMSLLYCLETRWHLLSKSRGQGQRTSCFTLDTQQRYQSKVVLTKSIWHSGKFLVSLLFYWFDVASDIVLITKVWQFGKAWPGYVLLGILLFHYVVALVLLVWRIQTSPKHKIVLLLFGLPVMPLLDTIMLIFLGMPHHLSRQYKSKFAAGVMLQWEDMFEMREVLEVVIEAIPTSVLQTAIFLLGNRPDLGWFLEARWYIVSAVGSTIQILRLVGIVLWESVTHGRAPWAVLWRRVSLDKANNWHTLQPAQKAATNTDGQQVVVSRDDQDDQTGAGLDADLQDL